eukprot:6463697-Amphidinium_carterae.1
MVLSGRSCPVEECSECRCLRIFSRQLPRWLALVCRTRSHAWSHASCCSGGGRRRRRTGGSTAPSCYQPVRDHRSIICPFLSTLINEGVLPRKDLYTRDELQEITIQAGLSEDVTIGHVDSNFAHNPSGFSVVAPQSDSAPESSILSKMQSPNSKSTSVVEESS